MTLEVLFVTADDEVLALRLLNRQHRAISEATESELRAVQQRLQRAQDLLARLIATAGKPESMVSCDACRKLLQEIEAWLRPVEKQS
jgi:ribose 1,5-bisphosphokinase PhnN